MRDLIELARRLRKTIEKLSVALEDSEAIENVELFPNWSGDEVSYIVGERVKYEGTLYKVLISHVSQSGWTPDNSPSLFAKVLIVEPDIVPVWEQPGSTNPYMIGDKVHYPDMDGPIYRSLIDNNIWSPQSYPAGWELVIE